ncbi:AraC family transcriptional regulator [Salmonella enterica subsp. arizonae]|uniref:AraC family transcriptional regulator n=1 Tax=Salmonella enterica subsp. arizonae TaxID=59203 RepID=A0A379SRY7_SALER|nr:AraC family transcriptional regulator [Salmonella enterica subsp. arizonae]
MKNVIIYGINWTNCYALESIFKQKYPEKRVKTCNSLTALLHSISAMPDAGLILSLNPHEHVYLFHALQSRLQSRKVLVVADRLYYIDRCVLQYFGVMDYVLKDELSCIIRPIERNPVFRKPGCVFATGHSGKPWLLRMLLMLMRRRKRYYLILINMPGGIYRPVSPKPNMRC